uniref:BHLH domain-containing protein n=1 Tax=Branchiostoma floridae TaxID=7739 RepID=C3Z2R6_BRAFL|eukprot:XP_002597305.1 hypothetical protein BRAFLDRAFT_66446 [Branchiostoma floridae]
MALSRLNLFPRQIKVSRGSMCQVQSTEAHAYDGLNKTRAYMNVEVSTTGGASDPALALRLNMQRDNEAYPLPPHKRVKTENMSYDLHGSISPVHMAFMTDSRGFRRRNMQGTEEQRDLHRIVEKRRRDRINDCLANIRELLPEELVRQKSPVDGVSCEKIESHLRRHCQRLSPYQGFPDTEETPGGLVRENISPQPEQQMPQDRPMPEEPQPPQHPPHMTDASQQTPSPQTAHQSHQAAVEESRRSPMSEPPRDRSPSRDSQPPHTPLPYSAFPPAPFIPMLALHPSGTHYIPVNFTPPTAVTPQGGQPGQNMVCPFPMMFPAPMYPGVYPPTSMASSGGRRISGIPVMTPYQPLSPHTSSDESPTTTPREEQHQHPNPSSHMRNHHQVPSNDPLNLSTRNVACPEGMSRSPDLPHTVYRHSHNWQNVSPQHGHAMSP